MQIIAFEIATSLELLVDSFLIVPKRRRRTWQKNVLQADAKLLQKKQHTEEKEQQK
jgi:hypothetical protein